jgi:hypothetical protein
MSDDYVHVSSGHQTIGGKQERSRRLFRVPAPPPPFHMIVNRPFFFSIVDTRTNQTLYMGTIVEP